MGVGERGWVGGVRWGAGAMHAFAGGWTATHDLKPSDEDSMQPSHPHRSEMKSSCTEALKRCGFSGAFTVPPVRVSPTVALE